MVTTIRVRVNAPQHREDAVSNCDDLITHGATLRIGESPMVSVKRLFKFSLLLAIGVAQSGFISNAQTPDNKSKATASIAGRVTIGDKPAPGVIVAASTLSFPQTVMAQTVSDAEGKYRINGLMPGQANVSAVAPTFVMP